jgi:serine/threonine-protein kinase RsbW
LEIKVKTIKFIIDSNLEDVALVGMSINRLCSLNPVLEQESFMTELCVVEAINNSIIHAYGNEKGHKVEVAFALTPDELLIKVYDNGKSMDKAELESRDLSSIEIDPGNLDTVESGRGLAIIKEVMDHVSYTTVDGINCLSLTKKLSV